VIKSAAEHCMCTWMEMFLIMNEQETT
jgi:hypothetical protein